jgi:branched-chain amino acid transport system permease protein
MAAARARPGGAPVIAFVVHSSTMIAVWAVLALSLNLQFGLTGLVNFGQVLPFALGAYAAAICATHGFGPGWGVVLAAVAAPLAGLVVIYPARRLAQDYWALVTLGAGEIFRLTMLNVRGIAGGVEGVSVTRLDDRTLALGLALALLAGAFVVSERVSRAPLGRLLRVLREDELLGASLGRNPFRFQTLVTAVAALLAGLAGVLYAHVTGFVHSSGFMVIETFLVWTAVILGGPGRSVGVVLGAGVVELLGVSTRFLAQWATLPSELVANLRLALIGLLLVVMLRYRPQGLLPELRMTADGHARRP